jgi:hypothetical protein
MTIKFITSPPSGTFPPRRKRQNHLRSYLPRNSLRKNQLSSLKNILAGYILLFYKLVYQSFYQIADIFFIITNCYIQSGSPCPNVLLPIRTVISRPPILSADTGEKEEGMLYLGTWR